MTQGEVTPPEGQGTAASMADLNTMETSLRSFMDTQLGEIRDLLTKLASAKAPSVETIPLEDEKPLKSDTGDSGDGKGKKDGGEETETDPKKSPPSITKPLGGKTESYHEVSPLGVYSPDPPILHPRINTLGPPPKLNALAFTSWQHSMKSHINSASIKLWRIVRVGFKAVDPNNLTRREVVDAQLNASALHMLELAVGDNGMHHIQHVTTTKEAWDCLQEVFLGNESMKRNRFDALTNDVEGFYMLDSETHEEMY
jgi:hypothetical protein